MFIHLHHKTKVFKMEKIQVVHKTTICVQSGQRFPEQESSQHHAPDFVVERSKVWAVTWPYIHCRPKKFYEYVHTYHDGMVNVETKTPLCRTFGEPEHCPVEM